ncbi:MAG: MBL fold metallo-hydrolase [Solirubrobacteraceae bacterium]|nr:MBL fold metallo-hydrolase [Solirubrobacteraceae bacterium]
MPALPSSVAQRLHHLGRRVACGPPVSVADGVTLLRGGAFRAMNVYLLDDPSGGVVAFDSGEKGMAGPILDAAAERGGLRRVILGHGDTDHRGAAPALRAAGVPIACHADAAPYAEGRGGREYWRPELLPRAVRAFHALSHRAVWDGGPVTIDETVAVGDDVCGFEVVDLAGHAPGQIGLWRASDRVAIVSDAFYVTSMWGRPQEPALPVRAYDHDLERARESLRRLAALDPATVLPGHLGPVTGDVRRRLEAAAEADVR